MMGVKERNSNPTTKSYVFPDGTLVPELKGPIQKRIAEILIKRAKAGQPVNLIDLQGVYPGLDPETTQDNAGGVINKLKNRFVDTDWTIETVKPTGNGIPIETAWKLKSKHETPDSEKTSLIGSSPQNGTTVFSSAKKNRVILSDTLSHPVEKDGKEERKSRELSFELPDGQKIKFYITSLREPKLLQMLIKAYKESRIPERTELLGILAATVEKDRIGKIKNLIENLRNRFREQNIRNWRIIDVFLPQKTGTEHETFALTTEAEQLIAYSNTGAKKENSPADFEQFMRAVANSVMNRLLEKESKNKSISTLGLLVDLAGDKLEEFRGKADFFQAQEFVIECFKKRATEIYERYYRNKISGQPPVDAKIFWEKFKLLKKLHGDKIIDEIRNIFPENITSSPESVSPEGKDRS